MVTIDHVFAAAIAVMLLLLMISTERLIAAINRLIEVGGRRPDPSPVLKLRLFVLAAFVVGMFFERLTTR